MARHGHHSSHSHSSSGSTQEPGSEVTPRTSVSPSIPSNSTNVEQHNTQLNDTRITQNNTSVTQNESTHIQQNTTSVQQHNTSNVDHSDNSIHVDRSTHVDHSSHDHSQRTIDIHNEGHLHLGGDDKKSDDGGSDPGKDDRSDSRDSRDAEPPGSSAPHDFPSPGDPGDYQPGRSRDEPPHTGSHEADQRHSGGSSHDADHEGEGEKGESKAGSLNDAFQGINSEWVGKALDQIDKVVDAGEGLIRGAEAVIHDVGECLFSPHGNPRHQQRPS